MYGLLYNELKLLLIALSHTPLTVSSSVSFSLYHTTLTITSYNLKMQLKNLDAFCFVRSCESHERSTPLFRGESS